MSFFLMSSASALDTPSLTAFPPASTRSLASLSPRAVISRTALMTSIFLSPWGLQNHVEFGLLFGGEQEAAPAAAGGGHGHGSGGGHAELLLESLDQLRKLRERSSSETAVTMSSRESLAILSSPFSYNRDSMACTED